ncbi:hypothetical protein SKAU_G00372010 [Synaphobranchus kaupii]|uniref:Gypsy retrotransposon integrase-like protein 1 n=1 Tax=Synaphobranchus kaupii TaxID=118154 RepID=A0A9Q1IF36_SYNKA|nr:hypothetical protein SKAU_G00372010 [Synaphobranchus kaupii]
MIGNLSAYEAKEQTWEEYCEILEQYFEANGIDNGEKQRAILISVVGRATYRLMRNLLSPDKPSSKMYDELKVLMQNHFSPKPSEIVQRYKFDSRSRQPNETVSEYVAELRQIAHDCNYGQTLEQMLRDRLVCGINDDRIQRRLLAETDLTFEKAYKMAVAAEAASRNVIDLQAKAAGNVNQVKTEAGAGAREDERADRELVLACDASPYGVGALLSHVMEDGSEKPLGFMSRTLTPAEKRYSQLDKEGLAIMFGIKRFHKYLYGRTFTISTDHKPLISLFHEKKPVPQMCSPRVQRWAVLLRAYEYKIVYKPGKEHANADALSRLPLPQTAEEDDTDQVLMINVMDDSPVTTTQVRKWTAKDKTLSQVHEWCLKGWPREVDSPYKPYSQRRLELSVKDGCVLWGARVVIPKRGRGSVLKQLHNTHPGISRMKGLARSYVWWPGMDMEIEQEVQSCLACQETRKCPARAPLHPWEWPEVPWSRLHIDYAGPFQGKMFLVIVDVHSKWIDVYPTSSATSETTIEKLRQCFSTHGLPQMIVSDNGTCFTSAEFELFMQKNGIQHVTSAPFHPASNGLAERAVQTFKEGLKKAKGGTMETKLARFLFNYRITPQTTTGLSPAEMLMSRRLRSTLDLLLPDVKSRVRRNQLRQKEQHDGHSKWRGFSPGEEVYVRNYSYGPKWILGRVEKCTGPVSYRVRTGDGQSKRRHVDQIRKRHVAETNDMTASGGAGEPSSLQGHAPSAETLTEDPGVSSPCGESVTVPEMVPEEPPAVPPLDRRAESSPVLRRSERTRQAPAHLKDFVP